jgi:hypothetical protein
MAAVADRTVHDYRALIDAALAHGDSLYTFDDVAAAVTQGSMRLWALPHSFLITQIIEYPRTNAIHVLLAGGRIEEIALAAPILEVWARANGCTRATLVGRAGWKRSFLAKSGWTENTSVVLEKLL